jgi:hypothetical protein
MFKKSLRSALLLGAITVGITQGHSMTWVDLSRSPAGTQTILSYAALTDQTSAHTATNALTLDAPVFKMTTAQPCISLDGAGGLTWGTSGNPTFDSTLAFIDVPVTSTMTFGSDLTISAPIYIRSEPVYLPMLPRRSAPSFTTTAKVSQSGN